MELLRNCKVVWTKKFVFPDDTEIIDDYEAFLYSDKYYEKIQGIQKRLNNYIEKYQAECVSNIYLQYEKEIINDIKKKYYCLLWDIYKDAKLNEFDKYFEIFVNNPENDMQGAARCLNHVPYKWNALIDLGEQIISFDNEGKKFLSFRDKCNYIDNYSY